MKSESNNSTNLAKVLWYYNLLYDPHVTKQKIPCPFHGDVNPSLLVDLVDGSWFCFGCQQGGEAWEFVKLMEDRCHKLNDLESYKKYLKILKSDKCSSIKIDTKAVRKIRKPKKQAYDESYDYYHGLRKVDWRSDPIEEVEKAREYMNNRGYSDQTLNQVGARVTYSDSYGLIFPMLDNGKFRGWVCRTMRKDIEAKRKYLYNEGFSRATTLVGTYGSKDFVIVVEGYMDRLRFVEYGMGDSVVAILGWKMSVQQEEKLRKCGIVKIISCLDNDVSGRKGTMYLRSVFGPQNVIRWSYLKGIKDPGDMDYIKFRKMYDRTMKNYYENISRGRQ